jgi:hypothetical protein
LGIKRQSYAELETAEARGGISLSSLGRAAEAMDCELICLIAPRQPTDRPTQASARAPAPVRQLVPTSAPGQTEPTRDHPTAAEPIAPPPAPTPTVAPVSVRASIPAGRPVAPVPPPPALCLENSWRLDARLAARH